jgi:riboflavin synthase alpha subunit
MFTGIVEETAVVEKIKPSAKSIELTVRAKICGRGLKIGDSLAVNGCCLTVVHLASRGAATLTAPAPSRAGNAPEATTSSKLPHRPM